MIGQLLTILLLCSLALSVQADFSELPPGCGAMEFEKNLVLDEYTPGTIIGGGGFDRDSLDAARIAQFEEAVVHQDSTISFQLMPLPYKARGLSLADEQQFHRIFDKISSLLSFQNLSDSSSSVGLNPFVSPVPGPRGLEVYFSCTTGACNGLKYCTDYSAVGDVKRFRSNEKKISRLVSQALSLLKDSMSKKRINAAAFRISKAMKKFDRALAKHPKSYALIYAGEGL